MLGFLKHDNWKIIQEGFRPETHQASESIFSLANGKMGIRANFEETYHGKTLQGSYIAGVYFPDKTRVGWWKNGYPKHFAKVLNSPNWMGINIQIEGEQLDLFSCETKDFVLTLDMKKGTLTRSFTATLTNGNKIYVNTSRFLSMNDAECGLIQYSITPINFSGIINFEPYIDGDVKNEDANYNENFWNIITTKSNNEDAYILAQTKDENFSAAFAMKWKLNTQNFQLSHSHKEKWTGLKLKVKASKNEVIHFEKFVGVTSSRYYKEDQLIKKAREKASFAYNQGYNKMLKQHINKWKTIWQYSDIKIEGDVAAQQAIRFNIFQLKQTYTGDDERLNIGPKGFTGEKYGGSTYWDTEAYCLPFFLATAPGNVSRNLLIYRYKHLEKAIKNAKQLGFANGAALYPMVTMNGEECHNEWEITFEEIHRNGAIAFAIYNYVSHTGDEKYLEQYGLEVLIAIARFWSQRVNWSAPKKQYVILGVTGPNEYENNINNNWYTNKIAKWCLLYASKSIEKIKKSNPERFSYIQTKTNLNLNEELAIWNQISNNMYLPFDDKRNIFLQQDSYMDKEQKLAAEIQINERPINQHWSWDRILRSCFIKQADTLQGIYLFENEFDTETIKRNFNFYEPRTVHESSLSACIHSIIASRIGNIKKAYDLYLRTSRLDLDDYNKEVHEGLHITSMAGTWMAIVEGFGGKRVINNELHLNPLIPKKWTSYSFHLIFRNKNLEIKVSQHQVQIISHSKYNLDINLYGKKIHLKPGSNSKVKIKKSNLYTNL